MNFAQNWKMNHRTSNLPSNTMKDPPSVTADDCPSTHFADVLLGSNDEKSAASKLVHPSTRAFSSLYDSKISMTGLQKIFSFFAFNRMLTSDVNKKRDPRQDPASTEIERKLTVSFPLTKKNSEKKLQKKNCKKNSKKEEDGRLKLKLEEKKSSPYQDDDCEVPQG
jgi:hypothetical protein